mgnify:CR=1 FL=1
MKLHLKITSTILCLSLLFLSSCAETPESVKKGSKMKTLRLRDMLSLRWMK